MSTERPDMVNRDPNNLNDGLQVMFEDVFGEPQGAHSPDCVWRNAYKCYEGGKNICYLLCSAICGLPIALCWGCEFAAIAFGHVWCITPEMRALSIGCSLCQKCSDICIKCMCAPICETIGLVFSRIKVTQA